MDRSSSQSDKDKINKAADHMINDLGSLCPPPPPNDKFFKIGEDKIVKNIRVLIYFKKGDVINKGYV